MHSGRKFEPRLSQPLAQVAGERVVSEKKERRRRRPLQWSNDLE